jgi:glutathione S-transferase
MTRFDGAGALLATVARGGSGGKLLRLGRRPQQRFVLYQLENCPYSRKVREALSMLDLDADIRPCPKGGQRFRAELQRAHGVDRVPFLVDPNTGTTIADSDDIVAHLFDTYGAGSVPWALRLGPLTNFTSKLVTALGGGIGPEALPSIAPAIPLELWSYETHRESHAVRYALDSYELPYTLYNVAPGSSKRRKLQSISAGERLPYLLDPNRGVHLCSADQIFRHLERAYGSGARRTTSYLDFMKAPAAAV